MLAVFPKIEGKCYDGKFGYRDCPDQETINYWVQRTDVRISGEGEADFDLVDKFSSVFFANKAISVRSSAFSVEATLLGAVDFRMSY